MYIVKLDDNEESKSRLWGFPDRVSAIKWINEQPAYNRDYEMRIGELTRYSMTPRLFTENAIERKKQYSLDYLKEKYKNAVYTDYGFGMISFKHDN